MNGAAARTFVRSREAVATAMCTACAAVAMLPPAVDRSSATAVRPAQPSSQVAFPRPFSMDDMFVSLPFNATLPSMLLSGYGVFQMNRNNRKPRRGQKSRPVSNYLRKQKASAAKKPKYVKPKPQALESIPSPVGAMEAAKLAKS